MSSPLPKEGGTYESYNMNGLTGGEIIQTKKQQNPMNENRIDKSMSYNRTPMNFVQRTKKQMRKTNRRTKNKIVQKHTSLKRDGVEMRDRPQRMTRYPKEKIGSLRKLSKRDSSALASDV